MSTILRRHLLSRASIGFGLTALAGLLQAETRSKRSIESVMDRPPAKVRSVIFLYMSGGVSHVDSFDPKPTLNRFEGSPMPLEVQRTQFNNNGTVQPSHWGFQRYGQSGIEVSDLFPKIGKVVDELCIIRSMTAKFSEHAQGNFFMHTGFPFLGYPSAGAWTSYGLGLSSSELPGYVVLQSGNAKVPHGGVGLYSNGFLPAQHQGSIVKADQPEAVANIRPRKSREMQREQLDFIGAMDRGFVSNSLLDPNVEAAISNYEMAWRMQTSVPELCDLAGETEATLRLYGIDDPEPNKAAYARQCLLARRLVERGVPFIELSTIAYNLGGGNAANPWDHHGNLKEGHSKMANQIDQPIAALVSDLKQRNLLEHTLLVWAGEFGRTPFAQGKDGRDHNPYGFTIWMAGGGIKNGHIYGSTDDFGYHATEKTCTVYDMWATVLHLMGIDHEQLTFRFGGRDLRLTDVHGEVLRGIIA